MGAPLPPADGTGGPVTDVTVLVVGGGPAGSACARELVAAGIDVLILDADVFPGGKPCAGWITPAVLAMLGIAPKDYPYSLTTYDCLRIHLGPLRFTVRSRQYAIRRCEFDPWLRERSGAPVVRHRVRRIERLDPGRHHGMRFLVDGRWRCRWLVGAGGTACPVRRALFRRDGDGGGDARPRWTAAARWREGPLVACLEAEYRGEGGPRLQPGRMELWFRLPGLDGYGWLLPKEGGWLNVGLGGRASGLTGGRLQELWQRFTERLVREGVLREVPPEAPRGYAYRLQDGSRTGRRGMTLPVRDGAVLAGDAAGMATADLGEGIGPAIASGVKAAGWVIAGGVVDGGPVVAGWSLPGENRCLGMVVRGVVGR